MSIECTECGGNVTQTPTMTGEILDCDECGAELEVTSLEPLKVQLAPEMEEDWGE